MTFRRSLIALACAQAMLQLTGCGGGSTSHAEADAYVNANNNQQAGNEQFGRSVQGQPDDLSVNAGSVQQADSGVQVLLQGSVSGGAEGYRYQWTQLSGNAVTINNASEAAASFITPKVTQLESLQFRLTVTDQEGNSASDTVIVVVSDLKPFARISSVSVSESTANAQLEVNLSEVPSDAVILNYETVAMTAQPGQDFTAVSGQLRFEAGQTQAQITVPITDDTILENEETFAVKISSEQRGGIALDTGVVTILDNDKLTGRALLGPVVNASVTISDYFTGTPLCRLNIPASTDLSTAGSFEVSRDCLTGTHAKLVTVSGGSDIDADDDGVLDEVSTPLARSFHAVLPASFAGVSSFTVSALSEAAYLRSTLSSPATDAALNADLNRSANALLTGSLDGTAGINANDLLFWNPQRDNTRFKKSADLLDLTTQSILQGYAALNLTQQSLATRLLNDPLGEVVSDAYGYLDYRPAPIAGGRASYLVLGGEGESYFQFDVSKPNAMTSLGENYLPGGLSPSELYAANNFIVAAYGNTVDVVSDTETFTNGSMGNYYGQTDIGPNGEIIHAVDDGSGFKIKSNTISTKGLLASVDGNANLDLVRSNNCPAVSDPNNFVSSGVSFLKVIGDHAAAFYYECSLFMPDTTYTATKTGVYWVNIADLKTPKVEKKVVFSSSLFNVADVAKNNNDLYVAAESAIVRVDLAAGKEAETLYTRSTFDSDARWMPTEIEAAGNRLYTLFVDTFTDVTNESFVLKADISDTANIKEVGRITLQNAGSCAFHPPVYFNYMPSIPNNRLSMNLRNGVILFQLFYAWSGEGVVYDMRVPGVLSFDANDLKGENNFISRYPYLSVCDNATQEL